MGGKLTMTAILIKAVTAALKEFPQFNASIDMETNEIIYKKYYHIGVAVDTDRGLLVPVIRDTDKKSIAQIAVELGEISAKARDKKLTLEDMSGATFTVSNLGGIGGEYFTPIVNWPEVASSAWPAARSSRSTVTASSCRARCSRCRCRTIIASSTVPTPHASCGG